MSAETELQQQLVDLKRQLETLGTQAAHLEERLENADPGAPAWQALAGIRQEMAGIRQERAAIRQEIVELRKTENLLLSQRQPAGVMELGTLLDHKLQELNQKLGETLEPLVDNVLKLKVDQYRAPSETTASGSSARDKDFRPRVLEAYQAVRVTADGKQESWCVVTGMWWPNHATIAKDTAYVTAAHIFKQNGPLGDWKSLTESDVSVDSSDVNGLPMMTVIEQAFDKFQIIVLPTAVESVQHPYGEYTVYILDPSLLDVNLYDKLKGSVCKSGADATRWISPAADCCTEAEGWPATGITFRQLHGRTLQFVSGCTKRPPKRLLTWHAYLSLVEARSLGWELPGDVPRSIGRDHLGWSSPTFESKRQQIVFWQAAAQAASAELPETAGASSAQ